MPSGQGIAVEMNDTPGYLDGILSAIHGANIDISYLYISFNRDNVKPVVVSNQRAGNCHLPHRTWLQAAGNILIAEIF